MARERVGGGQGIEARSVMVSKQGLAGQPARYLEVDIDGSHSAGVEYDTNIELPAGVAVLGEPLVHVRVGAGTLDVGILSTESGGDANGFLAAVSVAAAGMVQGSLANGAETIGTLLKETSSAGPVRKAHITDGTAKTISFTASSASLRGTILLPIVDAPNG